MRSVGTIDHMSFCSVERKCLFRTALEWRAQRLRFPRAPDEIGFRASDQILRFAVAASVTAAFT